jgi:hypothetical protein
MTAEAGDPPERVLEASRLPELLAERVLTAQSGTEPVPTAHINAKLDTAIILDKYEVALPAPLGKIVDQISDAENEEAGRLAWLFRPLQGAKG